MNEWLKNITAKFKELWAKWKPVQKAIAAGIVVVIIIALAVLFKGSSKKSGIAVFNTEITDEQNLNDIKLALSKENINVYDNGSGYLTVDDEYTARRARLILNEQNLIPMGTDPWDFLNVGEYSMTDFERQEKKAQAVEKEIEDLIKTNREIADAKLVIGYPPDEIFAEKQKPLTASLLLTFRSGSDMAHNTKKIRTIQNLLIHSIPGLKAEYITISDEENNTLNNFENLEEVERLTLIERTEKFKLDLANKKRVKVLKSLQEMYSKDRVREIDINIDMDTSEVSSDKNIITPIIITEQDRTKPYDTTEKRDYLPLASSRITKEWTGTGYNPQGVAGVDGENPPVHSDMSNVIGKSTETETIQNNVFNTEHRTEKRMPAVDRITVSVNIDGRWTEVTDGAGNPVFVDEKNIAKLKEDYPGWENSYLYRMEMGHQLRIYSPLSEKELEDTANYLQGAIGYDESRNYRVVVTNVKIDRKDEQNAADDDYLARKARNQTILFILIGVAVLLVAFIIFRFISREMERRRRLREEELLRRQQAEREKALWDAKNEGMEVQMSVEERKRAELQENAIAMAKEHPEDVAMLIRTWLMEE